MRAALRALRRLGIAAAALAAAGLLALLALAWLLQRPFGREWLRPRVEALAGDALHASLEIANLTQVSRDGIAVEGLALSSGGSRVVWAERARMRWALGALWPPRASLEVALDGFALTARRSADGQWDVVELFAPEGEDAAPPAWLAAVDILLSGGTASLSGVLGEPIELAGIDGHATVDLARAERPALRVDRIDCGWGEASRFSAGGTVELAGDTPLDLRVAVQPLAAADVRRFVQLWPAQAPVAGELRVAGTAREPRVEASVAAGGASLEVWSSFTPPVPSAPAPEPAAAAEGPPGAALAARGQRTEPAAAKVAVTASFLVRGIDPRWLAPEAPPGEIAGQGSVSAVLGGDSFPGEISGEARLWQSSLGELRTDWLTAQVRREGESVAVDLQAAAPGDLWRAEVRGAVDVAQPHAARAEIGLVAPDPAALAPRWGELLGEARLESWVTARADRLTGDGRTITADVSLDGSRLRGLHLDRALARVRWAAQRLEIDGLELRAGRTELAGHASLGLDEGGSLEANLVGPVDLGLLPSAGGRARIDLRAAGRRDAVQARLEAHSEGALRTPAGDGPLSATVEATRLGSATPAARARVTGSLTPAPGLERALGSTPQQLSLDLEWDRRPTSSDRRAFADREAAGGKDEGSAQPLQGNRRASGDRKAPGGEGGIGAPLDALRVALLVQGGEGRTQRATARIEGTGERLRVGLEELSLAPAAGGPWKLEQPAEILLSRESLAVDRLALRSGPAQVALRGSLERAGGRPSALELALRGVDLAGLCTLVAPALACGGRLDGRVALGGVAARPDLSGTLAVAGLRLGDHGDGSLSLALRTEGDLRIEGHLEVPPAGVLDLGGKLSLEPGWPLPGLAWSRPVELRASGDDLDIGVLRVLARPTTLTELRGRARLRLDVAGTLGDPLLSGDLGVDGLAIGIAATGTGVRDGRIAVRFDDRLVEVTELVAEGGALRGGGRIRLAAGHAPELDLRIDLAGLTVVDRSEVTARATGGLRLSGDLARPRLAGSVSVDPATLRPSLVPGDTMAEPDPTIVVVRPGEASGAASRPPRSLGEVLERASEAQRAPPGLATTLVDRLVIDLTVRLGDRVFVRRSDADIKLAGELYATKAPGDPLRVTGTVESERGWYVFQGRRLDVARLYLQLSGETPIDPYLDVLAIYRSPQYRISVAVQGTARNPSLQLSSEPPLDQSDILAVLLFGKPAAELTGGQGDSLQQQALALLASYVAPQLEKSVMDTFGLTAVTFQMPTGSTAGTLGVGRYFGEDIFISVAQDFGGPQGGTPRQLQGLLGSSVTVQYYLTPSVTLQGAASSQGESAIDVIWQRRY